MPPKIADTLVLSFTFGMSLRSWQTAGVLEREWRLYRALLDHYDRVVLVTYGDRSDHHVLRAILSPEEAPRVQIVCNDQALPIREFAGSITRRVLDAVPDSRSFVIKTNEMMSGEAAVQLAEDLRAQGYTAALVARGSYLWTRFVTHEHGPHSDLASDAAGRESILCQAADVIIGTTQDMVQDLAWRYHLDPSRCRVVPNFVLTDLEPAGTAERDPALLLTVGQLVPRKRTRILIEAVAQLPQNVRDRVRLEIIGEGPEHQALEALTARLGAPVSFRSRIPHAQVLEQMRRCALYLQASEIEGHPRTVLEAMSMGAPVLVADAPGLSSVVEHGSSGLRIAPTPDSFATAIGELLADEDWRELLGSAAARTTRLRVGLEPVAQLEARAHAQGVDHARTRLPLRAAG